MLCCQLLLMFLHMNDCLISNSNQLVDILFWCYCRHLELSLWGVMLDKVWSIYWRSESLWSKSPLWQEKVTQQPLWNSGPSPDNLNTSDNNMNYPTNAQCRMKLKLLFLCVSCWFLTCRILVLITGFYYPAVQDMIIWIYDFIVVLGIFFIDTKLRFYLLFFFF